MVVRAPRGRLQVGDLVEALEAQKPEVGARARRGRRDAGRSSRRTSRDRRAPAGRGRVLAGRASTGCSRKNRPPGARRSATVARKAAPARPGRAAGRRSSRTRRRSEPRGLSRRRPASVGDRRGRPRGTRWSPAGQGGARHLDGARRPVDSHDRQSAGRPQGDGIAPVATTQVEQVRSAAAGPSARKPLDGDRRELARRVAPERSAGPVVAVPVGRGVRRPGASEGRAVASRSGARRRELRGAVRAAPRADGDLAQALRALPGRRVLTPGAPGGDRVHRARRRRSTRRPRSARR